MKCSNLTFFFVVFFSLLMTTPLFAQTPDEFYAAYQQVEVVEGVAEGEYNNSEGLGGYMVWQENGQKLWSSTAITSEETGQWDFKQGQLSLIGSNGQLSRYDLVRFKNAYILVDMAKREVFVDLLKAYDDKRIKNDSFRNIHIYRYFSQKGFFINVRSRQS